MKTESELEIVSGGSISWWRGLFMLRVIIERSGPLPHIYSKIGRGNYFIVSKARANLNYKIG